MQATILTPVDEVSQVAEARRLARTRAEEIGFDEALAEQVAIVVTEAATNILRHAGRGEILINTVIGSDGAAAPGLEILGLDKGSGIDDLAACLQDGYSTGGTSGQGMGAIFRQSVYADVYSVRGKGTALLARWATPVTPLPSETPRLAIGAVNACKPGQLVCGDSWGCLQSADVATLMLADGLGHGYEASLASGNAVRILHEQAELEPKPLLEMTHLALRSTRGAAVAIARIDRVRGKLTFCGVGNVSAQIYSGSQARQHLVSVNGTAGHQNPQVREFSYPWPHNGLLILYTDGLQSAACLDAYPGVVLRDPSLIAGLLYRDFARGNDDATVVVVKEP